MKYQLLMTLVVTGFLSINAKAQSVAIDVTLKPAGSFTAKTSKVKGVAYQSGDTVTAENILVDLRSIDTGIALRDKHTKERMMVDKYPVAKLVKATGKGGKGKATLQIKGTTQEVDGTYKIEGGNLVAQFKMLASKIDITGVKYMGVGVSDEVTVNVTVPVKEGVAPTASTAKAN